MFLKFLSLEFAYFKQVNLHLWGKKELEKLLTPESKLVNIWI